MQLIIVSHSLHNQFVPSCSQAGVLVTGAAGHIGRAVRDALQSAGQSVIAVDIRRKPGVLACDLSNPADVEHVFEKHAISCVVHLAAVLPTAYAANPVSGAEINLVGAVHLLREAVKARVQRFVFASSISVYGLSRTGPVTEEDPAIPDEPYGGSKRAVELVGTALAALGAMEFVSLRISRVIGPGIQKTSSSPWRAQIFQRSGSMQRIRLPFPAESWISVLHVEDAARMLLELIQAQRTQHDIYNSPAEIWQVGEFAKLLERQRGVRVELAQKGRHGGPICEGQRFAQEFAFQIKGVRERLRTLNANRNTPADAQGNS
jgi:nucleoside-diphosphate-sugar epimerase